MQGFSQWISGFVHLFFSVKIPQSYFVMCFLNYSCILILSIHFFFYHRRDVLEQRPSFVQSRIESNDEHAAPLGFLSARRKSFSLFLTVWFLID